MNKPTTKKPSVICYITSRDGRIEAEVAMRASEALAFANSLGYPAEMRFVSDPYCAAVARNKAVADFLQRDADYLFFLDDDVTLQTDAIALLLNAKKELVTGCYPSFRYPDNKQGPPHLYVTAEKSKGQWFAGWFDGLIEVTGCGGGCLLIHREIFHKLGYPWFRWPESYDSQSKSIKVISDDVDFIDRAREAGFELWAFGAVRCGHLKKSDLAAWIRHATEIVPKSTWTGPQTVSQQRINKT